MDKLSQKSKYLFFSLPIIISIASLIQCLTMILKRHMTVSVMTVIMVILHIIMIINSGASIYFKDDAADLYFILMVCFIFGFFLSSVVFLQTYKQLKEQNQLFGNRQTILELIILLCIFSIVANVLLRNKSIMYIIDIVLSIIIIGSTLFINILQ